MTMTLETAVYNTLVGDISALYENARTVMVHSYWAIGKRIVEVEQEGKGHAHYGTRIITRLSRDLTKKYGSGFSKRNLERMRLFYQQNKIAPAPAQLTWTQCVELMSLHSNALRKKIAHRIVQENLSAREIRLLVKRAKSNEKSDKEGMKKLTVRRAPIHVFARVPRSECIPPKGCTVIDCGFHIWRTVKTSALKKVLLGVASFTYPATVLSVIDGDTIWVRIDCGFGTRIKEKIRLRGIDTPEIDTKEGRAAKRFVAKRLNVGDAIVVMTSVSGKYDRYIGDIFYAAEGIYLNQELLDCGYAVRM